MGKVALVFPGQGVQHPGMGRSLCEVSPAAADIFALADRIRPGTSRQCFEGTDEELKQTAITQPCLWTVEMAAAAALTEAGIHTDVCAGFSLGELAALSFAHIVDISTSFDLVCRRGKLMQEAAEAVDTAMAAVVKLDNETVESICARFDQVYPVNYNCPGQITVAGLRSSMADFSAAVKEARGRVLPMKVSGGFHSPFMASASESFATNLENVEFHNPIIPVYANKTALPYAGNMKQTLASQICSPVRWADTIRNMIDAGVDTFIEVGPGNVLQGFIARIDKSVRTFGVSDAETLKNAIEEVRP